MYSPIEAMTSWATAVISSSLPAKWYQISRVLDNPARSPIRANDTGICQPVWGTDLHLLLSGGLLRLGLVDPGRSGRAGRRRRLVDEPFGVGGVRRVKDAGPFGVDGLGAPVVHVGRDVQPQTGVPVLVVVPAEEGLTVHASRFDRGEAGGEVGPVLQRLELGLGVWVVIAHVRSGVGLGDPE